MVRLFGVIALLFLLLGTAAGDDTRSDVPEPPLREVVWRTVLQVLQERGLVILTASQEEGRAVTELASLDPAALAKVAILNDSDQKVQWARAEYRYHIDIGTLSDRERLVIKAEILAWERQTTPSAPRPEVKRALQSNNGLEREFVDAFNATLGKMAAE